jgi:hypothetical protein
MPGEGLIDLDTVSVEFTADATTSPVVLKRAADLGACAEDSYYTAELGGTATIKLCPTTCAQVSNASAIDVEIQCSGT